MNGAVENFLSTLEEQEVVEAIRLAEKNTSGEIRVHIEDTVNDNIKNRALAVFYALKMHNTKLANAVLIYVAVQDKCFYIYGDNGIHKKVPNNFWDSTKNTIENHFKANNFKQGLVDGILQIGQQLKTHFPWDLTDTNELPNTISKS